MIMAAVAYDLKKMMKFTQNRIKSKATIKACITFLKQYFIFSVLSPQKI